MIGRIAARLWPPRPGVIGITALLTAAAGVGVVVPRSHATTPNSRPFATPSDHVARVTVVSLGVPDAFREATILHAEVSPPRPGTPVVFQEQTNGTWVTVATGTQDAKGRAQARWKSSRVGSHVLQAAIFSTPGERARSSEPAWTVALAAGARIVSWREWIEPGISWAARSEFADEVGTILGDPRGWGSTGRVWFRHITSGSPDLWARLATPSTTDRLCLPADTRSWWSCRNSDSIVVNSDRWFKGSPTWSGTVIDYRTLVVNHETGHFLGFPHAVCPGRGRPAPVMMQQSKGLKGCTPNPRPLSEETASLL